MAFPKALAALSVAIVMLVPGCLKSPSAGPENSSTTPLGSTTSSPSSSANPTSPVAPGSFRVANLTDCQGSFNILNVPEDWVRDDLPASYEFRSIAGPDAIVHMDVEVCNRISIDGKDSGAAILTSLFVAAQPLDAVEGDTWFLFEYQTDNVALRDWLAEVGLTASNATATYSRTILADPLLSTMRAEVHDEGALKYGLDGETDNGRFPMEHNDLQYFTPDPKRWFYDNHTGIVSNGGPGKYSASADSRLSQILEGQTNGPDQAMAFRDASRVITIPEWD
jgi:hypothetical protein